MLKTTGLSDVPASRKNNSDGEVIRFGVSNGSDGKTPQYKRQLDHLISQPLVGMTVAGQPLEGMTAAGQPLGKTTATLRLIDLVLVEMV